MSQKPNYNLYISYSSRDEALVSRLIKGLAEKGINTSYDKNLVEFGDNWREKLTRGLAAADFVLVLLTESSISGGYVMNELGMAQGLGKFILPVIYGNIPIPEFIKDVQALFWRDNDEDVVENIARVVFNYKPNMEKDENQPDDGAPEGSSNITPTRNYWLLKMNAKTWEPENIKPKDSAFFNTHFFGEKRPEYALYGDIRIGDYILGFATGGYQGIFCLMEVTAPAGPNTTQGEGVKMIVKRLMDPVIHIQKLSAILSPILPKLSQTSKPPELLFRITEADYRSIMNIENGASVPYKNVFEPFYLTEGNHKGTEDKLGFINDYESFARVITLKKVEPPLAIGLFGNWGSGKSFFMEKLSSRIDKIIELNEPENIRDAVQVKFNSWHYSDANLWASLITQIFESLHDYASKKQFGAEAIKAIYKDLNITGQQLEETQKKLSANAVEETVLQERKATVEDTIQQKKARLDVWKARDFIKLVFSDPFIQHDFDNIKSQFKDEALIDNIYQIDEKLGSIDTTADRLIQSFILLKNNSKGRWKWIWILALLFAIAGWLALGPLNKIIRDTIHGAYIATGLFLVWLANLLVKLGPYIKKVTSFYKRLKSLKEKIDQEKEAVRLKEHEEIERLQRELDILASKKAALEAEQNQIKDIREKLQTEIKEIGSGKLLASFLAGKSADDAYIKQLGIISWVRKDFAKLNDLFQKQRSVQETEKGLPAEVQIDRIVLYIDDLDRCNEEVVVKVLEAIHLLLAFPLFVVVVGVDPRWLNNALSEKYKKLFGYAGEKKINGNEDTLPQVVEDNIPIRDAATSYDYLEKIFQIPFALKPINETGRKDLIEYLMREEMQADKSIGDVGNAPAVRNKPGAGAENDKEQSVKEDNAKTVAQTPELKQQSDEKVKERLTFTTAERAYMQTISSLFGQTPRTINRYVNIYRIVKAHGSLAVVGNYSKEEFMPIMLVLGIIVGCSELAEEFIEQLSKTKDLETFKSFLDGPVINKKMKSLLKPLSLDVEDLEMENFKRNIELISRFSFRTLLKED